MTEQNEIRISACGFDCRKCPEFDLCGGCRGEAPNEERIGACAIRACVLIRGLSTCAACADYPCELLEELFRVSVTAHQHLEALREQDKQRSVSMTKLIACCGLNCAECGAYLATIANDDALRKATAAEWSEMYHAEIKPEDINCSGCTGDGVLFHYPTVCEIRACVKGKGLPNCSKCPDYACEKLQEFFKMAPFAKATLDSLRV
jgi:hypothetical protein